MKPKLLSLATLTTFLLTTLSSSIYAADPIGQFTAPASVVTDPKQLGPTLFSNIVIFLTVIAGLWAFIQFILGGLGYITGSGDPKKVTESQNKIINSLIGIVIVAASFILAGIIGSLLFGSSSFILSPQFQTIN